MRSVAPWLIFIQSIYRLLTNSIQVVLQTTGIIILLFPNIKLKMEDTMNPQDQHPMLFTDIVKEIIDEFGDRGEEVIAEAVLDRSIEENG